MSVVTLGVLVGQAMTRRDAVGEPTVRALRDRAIVLLGFALGARRSELVALDVADVTDCAEGLSVAVLRAKTRTETDDVAVPWAAKATVCPVRAVRAYLAALAERGITAGPLFRRITRSDTVLPDRLTPESVADVVAGLAKAADLPVPAGFRGWSGHSLRRGFATEARRAGADPLRIARQGGWTDGSRALAGYLADVDRWTAHPLTGVL